MPLCSTTRTFAPFLAAAIAAHTPAGPPPTTNTSVDSHGRCDNCASPVCAASTPPIVGCNRPTRHARECRERGTLQKTQPTYAMVFIHNPLSFQGFHGVCPHRLYILPHAQFPIGRLLICHSPSADSRSICRFPRHWWSHGEPSRRTPSHRQSISPPPRCACPGASRHSPFKAS